MAPRARVSEGSGAAVAMRDTDGVLSSSIETIPHNSQAYDTVGDYFFCGHAGSHLKVVVSDMGDWRFGFSCGIHELIEAALQVANGKKDESTEFDKLYEDARQAYLSLERISLAHAIPGDDLPHSAIITRYRITWDCNCKIDADSEPGEDKHAPYHDEHMFADGIERLLLRELGADWGDYCAAVERLDYQPKEARHAGDQE